MTTFADPTRCPDCGAVLPQAPQSCPSCALPLAGSTAASLFTALSEADRLLGVLRSQKQPVPVTAGAPASKATRLDELPPYPVASGPAKPELRMPPLRGASVPKILLSLGALCLLVAAVIFLAVAWSWLGVGGRTVVLVALTAAALGLGIALASRGLRTAAESLTAVGLGLLAVDVVGIRHAGWFVPVDESYVVVLGGAVVATGAVVVLVATARHPLMVPGLVAPFAVLIAGIGAEVNREQLVPLVVTLVVLLGCARLGTSLPSRPLQVASTIAGCLGWILLVLAAVFQLEESPVTVSRYLGHLDAWPLVAATILAAVVGPASGIRGKLALSGYAVAGLTGSCAVLMPVLDNGPTAATSSLLVASLGWLAAVLAARRPLAVAALLPLAGTLVAPALAAVELIGQAVASVLSVGEPFSQPYGVRLAAPTTYVSPLLLLPVVLTVTAAGCAAWRLAKPVRRAQWTIASAGALGLGAIWTLPLYDVPLALIAALLVAAAVGAVIASEHLDRTASETVRLVALGLGLCTALLALPSDVIVSGTLLVVCLTSGYLATGARPGRTSALVCFPVAFAGLVWAGGNVVGLDDQFRALPVLIVLGALVIWKPELELEAATAVAGAMVSTASILLAPNLDVSLAVHLTVAGVVVTATSIVHPSRRLLAWPGGLLLAAATWVRLIDLGVHVPEAYTLPSALVLTVVGLWHLRSDSRSDTLTVLAPGLALATVPSLVAMLHDPYSLRALLLGVVCLSLTVGGAIVRWNAPLVVGATVGALLVLRELAPYAAHVPSWMTIGVAGALLLGFGITWESRMNDVRRASRYVTSLR